MNSPKSVGRIGALAVALGVGAAVVGGTGIASADGRPQQDTNAATNSRQSSDPSGPRTRRDAAPTGSRAGREGAPQAAAASAPPPASGRNSTRTPSAARTAAGPSAAQSIPTRSLPPPPARAVLNVSPTAASAPLVASPPAPLAASTAAPLSAPSARAVASAGPAAAADAVPRLATAARAVSVAQVGVVSRILDRLATLGGSTPGTPDSPALWALLAWARRGRTVTTQPAAAVSQPNSLDSTQLGWVTGQRNNAYPGATWKQVNNTKWANVYGTDLGIMWFNGENGLTQLAFGDTFSGANMSGDWRSNVLLLSDDTNLTDGLTLINTGPAYQFIPAAPNQVFFIGSEVTNIPTSALYANDNNYVSYMSVKSWDTPGRWTTNYSAVSQYNPATDQWVLQKSTIRSAGWFRARKAYVPGNQNFQQMAYVLEPESQVAPGGTRYVYAFGTPAGRAGSAYLSRVPEGAVTNLNQYEYWDGSQWVKKQAQAAPVIGASTKSTGLFGPIIDLANNPNFFGGWFAGFTGAKTGGNVSEMSVQYNDYLGKYVVLYGNGANNVILRTADSPEGPWSDPITIATSIQYPGLYAPMIHPLSGTGQLTDSNGAPDISNLYWNMSIWSNYNVVLMQTDLSPLKATLV